MLGSSGLVDSDWLLHHMVHVESLPFCDQVALMRDTDLLISPHGAALTNLMFMRKHSAVIELMTAPWYEIGYQPSAIVFGIHYNVVVQTDFSKTYSCAMPRECLETSLIVDRKNLKCYGIRQCNALVDVGALEVAVWQASQHIRVLKRSMFSKQMIDYCLAHAYSSDGQFHSSNENDIDWTLCSYKKSYEIALGP